MPFSEILQQIEPDPKNIPIAQKLLISELEKIIKTDLNREIDSNENETNFIEKNELNLSPEKLKSIDLSKNEKANQLIISYSNFILNCNKKSFKIIKYFNIFLILKLFILIIFVSFFLILLFDFFYKFWNFLFEKVFFGV